MGHAVRVLDRPRSRSHPGLGSPQAAGAGCVSPSTAATAMHQRLRDKLAELDLDRLQEVLDYDPETGVFMWLVRLGPKARFDRPAGKTVFGYRRITIDKVDYPANHLAWFHFYGAPAERALDFINLDRSDLRIANLRLATASENARNQRRNARNTTGFKGVARYSERYTRAKYRSSIRVEGKRIFLGLFHTPEEAYEAYCRAVEKYHGRFGRTE
jgi:hypothetical protein